MAKKKRGKYNRTHEHQGQNNATPDNDTPGQGPNPNRGGGPPGAGQVPDIDEIIARAIRGGAKVAYGNELRENREQFQQLRGQGREMDRAYDSYAQQITQQQQAQAQLAGGLIQQTGAAAAQLGQVGANVTSEGAAQAAQRAQTLGLGNTEQAAFQNLGGSAGLSRASLASSRIGGQNALGIGNLTELGSRAVTGERDRVRARDELQQLKRGNREERQQILREKGGWMADRLYEYLQQQEENAIARMGLANERRGLKNERKDDISDTALAYDQIAADIAMNTQDNQTDLQENQQDNAGGGGGGDGTAGFTDSEQKEIHETRTDIRAFSGAYQKAIEKGLSPHEAIQRAKKDTSLGGETWLIPIAVSLSKGKSLTPNQIAILKSKMPPGWTVPSGWA